MLSISCAWNSKMEANVQMLARLRLCRACASYPTSSPAKFLSHALPCVLRLLACSLIKDVKSTDWHVDLEFGAKSQLLSFGIRSPQREAGSGRHVWPALGMCRFVVVVRIG